jgi:hypothetical protein
MRSPIRLAWRGGTMAVKLDECPHCGVVDRHRIERQVRWLCIGPIGILPTGVRHGLECFTCRHWEPLAWSAAWPGIRTGRLALPDRPRSAAATTAVLAGQPVDLDRVNRNRSMDGATVTVGVWAIVVAILVGLALQPPAKESVADEHIPWCLKVDGVPLGSPIPSLTTSTPVVRTLCVFPHNWEPIATPAAPFGPGATLPLGPGFGPEVQAVCEAAYRQAFGRAPGGSPPTLVQVGPGPSSWAAGDRTVWCSVADPAQAWSTTILAPAP